MFSQIFYQGSIFLVLKLEFHNEVDFFTGSFAFKENGFLVTFSNIAARKIDKHVIIEFSVLYLMTVLFPKSKG